MVMYSTGETRRLRNPGCKGACISRFAPRTPWRPCTVARPQVASFRFVLISVRLWLALDEAADCNMSRSLRATLPPSQENVPQRSHLAWSTRSAAGSTAASAVGSAAGFTSGAARGFAAGSAAGSSERISMLLRNSGFENFPNRWGIAELFRRQESTENGAHTTTSLCSHWLSHVLSTKRKERVLPANTTLCAIVEASRLNNNSEECKSHSGHAQVHAQNVSTIAPPSYATPDGQWHANCSAELFQPQKQLFITDQMCLPMLRPIYTQSCGKETPCGKSPSHTRVGSQALLDRLHGERP